ncbi:MAG: AMP-dependent synthetase/ligase [Gammaproteobacteria bacterium]
MALTEEVITPDTAKTLPGLFRERVRRTPEAIAYRFFDALNGVWADYSWGAMAREVARWQMAFAKEALDPGDRVALMARNSRFWVMFDQAALGLGLVVVPLYTEDRADNVDYILRDAGVKLLILGGPPQWDRLHKKIKTTRTLIRIISIAELSDNEEKRLASLGAWLPQQVQGPDLPPLDPDALATIVYTSGTTGRPKGVMLSHRNILSNAYSGLQTVTVTPDNVFLSFLPLSHTLERTVGYYLPMMAGATVAHARSIPELARDLQIIKPTGLISVPRIFERMYVRVKDNLAAQPPIARRIFQLTVDIGWQRFEYLQGRAKWRPGLLLWPVLKKAVADKITQQLGGHLKVVISGGAALSPEVSRVFIAMGVPILQGYGLTEASPVVSVNRLDDNIPASIGTAFPGVEVRIGEDDELLVRGENVMLGFWNNPQATGSVIDAEGWLYTGDKARIEDGHIYITGRIKDIIVLANGEKVSPTDMEMAITADPLFDQVILIGEACPYLTVLAVLNETQWTKLDGEKKQEAAAQQQIDMEQILLERVRRCLHDFPGYAQVHRITCIKEAWTVENGLLTPTLKVKRKQVQARYMDEIKQMYTGHTL